MRRPEIRYPSRPRWIPRDRERKERIAQQNTLSQGIRGYGVTNLFRPPPAERRLDQELPSVNETRTRGPLFGVDLKKKIQV